jgi:hypothetical protein
MDHDQEKRRAGSRRIIRRSLDLARAEGRPPPTLVNPNVLEGYLSDTLTLRAMIDLMHEAAAVDTRREKHQPMML